jgi:DNA-binding CsgD family transcriptional regulator
MPLGVMLLSPSYDNTDSAPPDEGPQLAKLDEVAAASLWREMRAGGWSIVEEYERDGRRFLVARRVRAHVDRLTAREREIVERVVSGASSKAIGLELGVAASTVAGHLANAMKKLGVPSRIALVRVYRFLAKESQP